jgi:hypothetical protein
MSPTEEARERRRRDDAIHDILAGLAKNEREIAIVKWMVGGVLALLGVILERVFSLPR